MRIQHLNHSTYQLQYHLVWGTKYRYPYLKPYVKTALLHSLYATCKKYPTLYIHTVNTDQDHVHLQIEIAPSVRVADAVQKLKSNSSFYLKQKFKFIKDMYLEDSIWSVGYFVSSIGLNEQQIKKYIQYQGKTEQPQTIRLWKQPKLL
jgi:putative transposase